MVGDGRVQAGPGASGRGVPTSGVHNGIDDDAVGEGGVGNCRAPLVHPLRHLQCGESIADGGRGVGLAGSADVFPIEHRHQITPAIFYVRAGYAPEVGGFAVRAGATGDITIQSRSRVMVSAHVNANAGCARDLCREIGINVARSLCGLGPSKNNARIFYCRPVNVRGLVTGDVGTQRALRHQRFS